MSVCSKPCPQLHCTSCLILVSVLSPDLAVLVEALRAVPEPPLSDCVRVGQEVRILLRMTALQFTCTDVGTSVLAGPMYLDGIACPGLEMFLSSLFRTDASD